MSALGRKQTIARGALADVVSVWLEIDSLAVSDVALCSVHLFDNVRSPPRRT